MWQIDARVYTLHITVWDYHAERATLRVTLVVCHRIHAKNAKSSNGALPATHELAILVLGPQATCPLLAGKHIAAGALANCDLRLCVVVGSAAVVWDSRKQGDLLRRFACCSRFGTLDSLDTVVVAARQLSMAIGAVRAAGIAAVALGYHFWKLLTKHDLNFDTSSTEEVGAARMLSLCCVLQQNLLQAVLRTCGHQSIVCSP